MSKLKTYDFWVKLSAAVLLLLRIIGSQFGFQIDSILFMDIVTAVAGVLVVLGIIQAPSSLTKINKNNKKMEDNIEEIYNDEEEK